MKPTLNKTVILDWITVILWSWFLLSYWTLIPLPTFFIPNEALTACLILCLQVLAHADMKKIISFKDKDMNLLLLITAVTMICLLLVNSNMGAFFTVFNFCLLWYLSDKWVWNPLQMISVCACCAAIFLSWVITPQLWGSGTNPNMTGTITVFSMLVLVTGLALYWPDAKGSKLLQLVLILLGLRQLFLNHGRGTLIALTFYCVLRFIIPKRWWLKEIFFKSLCYLLTLGSILFVLLYTLTWRLTDSSFVIPYFGKKIFSGREKIWYGFWNLFKQQPLTGTGTNITVDFYFELNVHNAMYDILVIHGILVFTLVLIYLMRRFMNLYRKYHTYDLFIPVISGIMAIFAESFTDMDLFWSPQFLVWTIMMVILNSALSKQTTHYENEHGGINEA